MLRHFPKFSIIPLLLIVNSSLLLRPKSLGSSVAPPTHTPPSHIGSSLGSAFRLRIRTILVTSIALSRSSTASLVSFAHPRSCQTHAHPRAFALTHLCHSVRKHSSRPSTWMNPAESRFVTAGRPILSQPPPYTSDPLYSALFSFLSSFSF